LGTLTGKFMVPGNFYKPLTIIPGREDPFNYLLLAKFLGRIRKVVSHWVRLRESGIRR